jgi:hypothetical protein
VCEMCEVCDVWCSGECTVRDVHPTEWFGQYYPTVGSTGLY